jgi:spore coat polysaccharide biosynthesis protein SpsF
MTHRFLFDYPEVYEFVSRVYDELYEERPRFSAEDVLALLGRKPGIARLNEKRAGVSWYRHHPGDLRTALPGATLSCAPTPEEELPSRSIRVVTPVRR